MTIANWKGIAVKGMLTGLAAGALLFAGPAQAERFAVGLGFGYRAPAPIIVEAYPRHPDFAFERRQEFFRHEEWMRAHRFYGYR